jgi:hypothetical protein
MAWQDEPTIILRDIVGDEGTTYTDAKIRRLLAVSMFRVRAEISLDHTYEVDLTAAAEDVTPDPSTRSPKDYDAINLMSLKASITLLSAELKVAAGQAFTIKDGPSTISTSDKVKYLNTRLQWAQDEYNDYVKNYFAGSSKYGGAVSTPFTRYGSSGGWSGTERAGE